MTRPERRRASVSAAVATDDAVDVARALNVRSQFPAVQAASLGMVERRSGSLVNTASVASSLLRAEMVALAASFGSDKRAAAAGQAHVIGGGRATG